MADSIPQDQSLVEKYGSWNQVYKMLEPAELPWNAGGPDPELVQYVDSGKIAAGRAIDVGAGLGYDAIFLAQKGFRVLAIDVAASAVELAKDNARKAGIGTAVDFRVEDVLKLNSTMGSASFVNDRGCFHLLPPGDRQKYVDHIHKLLAPEGYLLLRTISDQEPPGPGPFRFSRRELESLFSPRFDFVDFKEGIFAGPKKPKAYLCLLKRKP